MADGHYSGGKMKILLVFLGLNAVAVKTFSISNDSMDEWQMFKKQYGKTYKNESDEKFRMQVFANNSRYINEHNKRYAKGEFTFTLRMNKFGDMLMREVEQTILKNSPRKRTVSSDSSCEKITLNLTSDLSKEWDWRKQEAVTPVKDQTKYNCGACWAFSAVAALESHHYIRTKEVVDLSEQNLLDCVIDRPSEGCNGGFASDGLRYVADNQGVDGEKYYPYKGKNGKCKYNSTYSADKIKGCRMLPEKDEEQLKMAIEKIGPVAVAMHVDKSLTFFEKGIYFSKYCVSHPYAALNHEILAAGFGTSDEGEDYWLLKNSWGMDWGEEGFFKILRNAKSHCGIADDSNYPIA